MVELGSSKRLKMDTPIRPGVAASELFYINALLAAAPSAYMLWHGV